MCGLLAITGDYDLDSAKEAHRSMLHRGTGKPEHTLFLQTDGSFCGHNTLPFSSHQGTSQPRETSGGTSMFVGEIFNWKEIARTADLQDCLSDTDLVNIIFNDQKLLDSYVHEMDGFWSYVFVRHDSVTAYTDYLAQKPLFYRTDMNAVASEPDALAMLSETDKDEVYLSNTVKWGYSPDGRTPWVQIKQIPPGCKYIDGVISEYYDWDKVEAVPAHGLYLTLRKAVKDRIFSIQKLGILLSGGIDSSLVYLIAKEYDPNIKSFHIENGEGEFVRLVDPESTPLDYSDVTLEEAVAAMQTPSDLGSTIPQTVLAKAVNKEGIRAVLTGDGADELFGGYRRAKEYDSQYSDVFVELPYYHFQRLDRVMMAYTIEQRSPFLNPKIVKCALGLPWSLRTEKELVKTMARCAGVPSEIIDRPKLPLKSSQIKETPFEHRKDLLKIWREMH